MTADRSSLLRTLVLAAAAAGSLMLGCGPVGQTCNPTECASGCCDSNGVCQPGVVPTACGAFGNACQVCAADNVCTGGTCIPFATSGPKTDGGNNPGDGGQNDGGQGDGGMGDGGQNDGGMGDGGMGDGGQNDGGLDAGCKVNGAGCTSNGACCSGYCSTTEGICTNAPPPDSGPWMGENCNTVETGLVFTTISSTQVQAVANHSLTGYVHESTGTCGGLGPDRVYSFTTSQLLDVDVSVQGFGSLAPVAYLRSNSCTTNELTCGSAGAGGTATFQYTALPAGTYYLWVDAATSSGGSYTLTITASVPAPQQSGDLCSAPNSLTFSADTAQATGDTTGLSNDISTTASGCTSATGADVFYTIYNPGNATLTAYVTPTSSGYQPTVYFRSACTTSTLSCGTASSTGASAVATLTNATAGTYYVVVDGAYSTSGAYVLDVYRTPTAQTGDTCSAANSLSFSSSNTAQAFGDTTGLVSDTSTTSSGCVSATGPDVFYTIYNPGTATLTASVTPTSSGYQPSVHLRTSCSATSLTCGTASSSGSTATATLTNAAAGTYYVVVDGAYSSSGAYTLDLSRTPTSSGGSGESCSSPITLSFSGSTSQTATASGTTATAVHNYSPTCAVSGSTAPDRVYTFTTSTTKSFSATVTPSPGWDVGISLTNSPCGSGSSLQCSDAYASSPETITQSSLPAGTYYIWIDGYETSASGSYTLDVYLN